MGKCYMTRLHVTVTYQGCYRVTSHDKCGKVVYRPCSSCISSIQNLMGTPLSFSCQLGLEIVLRCLSLSSYTRVIFK